MRIAQILGSISSEASGPSYTVPSLSRHLAMGGHDVDVLTLGPQPEIERDGVREIRSRPQFETGPLAKLGFSAAMRERLAGGEYDILHTHGLWSMVNVTPAALSLRQGIPFLLSPRGMLGEDALRFSRIRKRIFWAACQRRSALAVNCFHATSYQEYLDIRRSGLSQPVAVIPNGIDVPDPTNGGVDEGCEEGRPKIVLSLGRIHPKKGLAGLIRAWSFLPEPLRAGWRLKLVGPDEIGHANELSRLINQLALRDVDIQGPVFGSEKVALARKAELFVLPTLNENFAMTVAESLAVGTPVISTVGAPWRGLVDNECGWWIEHGVEPMAAALGEAMQLSCNRRRDLGSNGREWMLRDFAWSGISAQMERVYLWLLGRADKPRCVIEG